MKLRVCIFFLLFSQLSFTQNCDIDQISHLVEKKQYALVYSMLDNLQNCNSISKRNMEWAQYQQAFCALELFNDEAQFRLEQYLSNYPYGRFRKEAYLNLSKLHFRNKEFEKVIAKLSNISIYDLEFEEEAMYYFRLGYSYFALDKYEEAKIAFFDLKNIKFTYTDLTTYCLAHMAYAEGNFATALVGFEKLLTTPKLGIISKYYITHIYYYQKQYQKLLDFAQPLLDNSYNPKRDDELKRLIGNAYFALGKYASSIDYLESYLSDKSNTLERAEKYQLGLAYFEIEDFEKASSFFEDILEDKDSLSQFAAHQLAQSYLKNNQKTKAINAFKYASSINHDYTLQEDAAFNYVKLIFENHSSYDNAIESIEEFTEKYPLSPNIAYVQDLLIKAFTSTKDYQSAVNKLSALNSMSYPQQEVYQKLTYYLAAEHLVNKRIEESINWFNKSIKFPVNNNLLALSHYWKAEAYYLLEDYQQSIESFKIFNTKDGAFLLEEYANSHYSLAYAYFQSNKFKEAIIWFRKYVRESTSNDKLTDAYLRLGDAYYMTRDYNRAQEFYALAEQSGAFDVDYSIHQQIQCFGLTNQLNMKRTALNQLISDYPNSPYNDDAMLNLSTMFLNEDRQEESVQLLKKLIKKHPQSTLVKTALLKLGLNFYNENQSDSAIFYFQKVINNYPNSSESKEALTAYKNASIESGDVKSYFNYIGELSDVSVDVASKDSISYEASENLYLKQDYEKAIQAFSAYLSDFKSPIFKLNAHFYKAESLFRNNPESAIDDYLSVLEFSQNEFSERSLMRLSRIQYDRQEYGVAALHYTKLLDIAQDNNLKRECTIRLFYCYKNLNINADLIAYSKAVLDLEKLDDELANEARLVIANNYYQESEFHLAKKEYLLIIEGSKSEIGSEAKYQLAYLAFLESEFDKSEKLIFELSENFFSDFYIAKSFILLADIYKERGNLFQSKATLQSIVENYDGKDLIEICNQKIAEIEEINEQEKNNSEKEELIIDLLNDIELNELFEEETTLEDEE